MSVIDELTEVFRKFPGVGPRQAERFVYYLLRQKKDYLSKFSSLLPELSDKVHTCSSCNRFFIDENANSKSTADIECNICGNKNRDKQTIMIVARDVDLTSIEKSGNYNGMYYVMGGLIPILDKNPYTRVRIDNLKKNIGDRINADNLAEIIIALSVNPEGENTADIIKKELADLIKDKNIKITTLGRGLSTGTELEYSDSETIKNALGNRF